MISWIKNYLQYRRLRVIINGEKSGEADVTSGVPQGSVLGPLLFLIYVNDISDNIDSSARLFEDDCVLYREIHDKRDCATLQGDIDRITQWCADWHTKLNVKQYTCVFLKKELSNFRLFTALMEHSYCPYANLNIWECSLPPTYCGHDILTMPLQKHLVRSGISKGMPNNFQSMQGLYFIFPVYDQCLSTPVCFEIPGHKRT